MAYYIVSYSFPFLKLKSFRRYLRDERRVFASISGISVDLKKEEIHSLSQRIVIDIPGDSMTNRRAARGPDFEI